MGFRSPAVWIALIVLVIVLFGASKLPDITRNLGKSMKIFKEEVRDLRDDVDVSGTSSAPTTIPPAPAAPVDPSVQAPPAPPVQAPPVQPQPVDPPQAPHPSSDQQ